MANTPNIRFKGFADDWEQRKLGEVLERRIEQRQQSEEYPRLAFASGQGVIPLSERKTNNREQLTKDEFTKKYLVTELNDIVYNPANVKYGAIDRNKCGRGLISPIYVTFTTNEIPGFIERIVTSHDFQQRALRFEEGTVTKRQSVNPEDLVTLDILVAPQKEEQEKISTYFDELDNLITIHQRKCDEVRQLKKFMLQKMFPKSGELIPEIRFAGFTGNWEQRKIKDIAPLQRGFDLPTSQMEEGIYPVVMSNGIGGQHSQYKVKGPGVVTGRSGTIGKLHYIEADYWPHNTTLWVTDFYGNNQKFIYYMYQYLDLSRFSTGSGVPTLNRNDVHDEVVCIPSVDEQKKISEYLTNLDHLITLHQHKCDQLKEVKRFMLQNMFPQKG